MKGIRKKTSVIEEDQCMNFLEDNNNAIRVLSVLKYKILLDNYYRLSNVTKNLKMIPPVFASISFSLRLFHWVMDSKMHHHIFTSLV